MDMLTPDEQATVDVIVRNAQPDAEARRLHEYTTKVLANLEQDRRDTLRKLGMIESDLRVKRAIWRGTSWAARKEGA